MVRQPRSTEGRKVNTAGTNKPVSSEPEDAYAVAAALGSPMPAPLRSTVITAVVRDSDSSRAKTLFSGVFQTRSDAEVSLARWCLMQFHRTRTQPWFTDEFESQHPELDEDELGRFWLRTHTPQDVIVAYFTAGPEVCELWTRQPESVPVWGGEEEIAAIMRRHP